MGNLALRQPEPVPAQLVRNNRQAPQIELGRLSRLLGLSAEQREQLRPILSSEAQKIRSLFADKSLSADVRRQKLAEIQDAARKQIGQVLTPEQAKRLGGLGAWFLGR